MTTPVMTKTMSTYANYEYVPTQSKKEDIPALFENLAKTTSENLTRIKVDGITNDECSEAKGWIKIIDSFVSKIPEAIRNLYSSAVRELRVIAEEVCQEICNCVKTSKYSSETGLSYDASKEVGNKIVFSCENKTNASEKTVVAQKATKRTIPTKLTFRSDQGEVKAMYNSFLGSVYKVPGSDIYSRTAAQLENFLAGYAEDLEQAQIDYIENQIAVNRRKSSERSNAETQDVYKKYLSRSVGYSF